MTDEIKLPEVDLTQLRVGGEVWVRGTVETLDPKDEERPVEVQIGSRVVWPRPSDIVRILPPPETDAEKIARLESEKETMRRTLEGLERVLAGVVRRRVEHLAPESSADVYETYEIGSGRAVG